MDKPALPFQIFVLSELLTIVYFEIILGFSSCIIYLLLCVLFTLLVAQSQLESGSINKLNQINK